MNPETNKACWHISFYTTEQLMNVVNVKKICQITHLKYNNWWQTQYKVIMF